jgi:glutamate:GABA antiporter
MSKKISLMSLMILIIAAIDNMRNLPAAALFGTSLLFFFALSAIVFLIPTSLVSAELSAAFPEKGGIYQWVNLAFGKRWAMAAIWLQWINTMVWYPTMLSFIAGTFAYLINPELAQNKVYLVSLILALFWGLTFVNMKGLQVSTMINNIFCVIGTMIPLLLLIVLGGVWFFSGKPLQITFSLDNLIPPLNNTTSWASLIAIMASFLGMELSGVHVNDIINPQKNFPKAVLLACIFILFSMTLGSLSIAFVLPGAEINLVSGVMQLYNRFFEAFGIEFLTPLVTLLIVVGSTGTMINWLISPAKGLLHAAEFGFLPSTFLKKNKHGVATNILLGQAVVVTLLCFLFLFEPSINGFYWFLTALSTELYMVMYVLMFCTAIRLHYLHTDRAGTFKIPGGSLGLWLTCLLGLLGSIATIIVTFFPADNVDLGSPLRYVVMICIGNILAITPLLFFYLYEKKGQKISFDH